MRSRSLIKKIGAVLLATTIFASIGLTGYADIIDGENATADQLAGNVSAEIVVNDIVGGYGFYNVAVTYTNDSSSVVGVTMLAYAETANNTAADGLESSDITNGYSEELQIVGINQAAVTTGGTFNFLVDTNPNTNSGAIRMDRGDSGIVLLSADGATAPTGYLFTIPAAQEFTVTNAVPVNASITVPYGTSVEEVKAALKSESITVSGPNASNETVTEQSWSAENWTFAPDYSATTSATYTATGELVIPDGSNGSLDGGVTTVSIDVIVSDPTLIWTATNASLADISVTVPTGGDEDAIIRAALLEKSITIDDEDETTPAALVPITEEIADTLEIQDESTKQYLLEVLPGSPVVAVPGHMVNIQEGLVCYFTVTVTYDGATEPDPDEPTGFAATGIKAVDTSGNKVETVEVANGKSEAEAIDAIKAAIADIIAYNDSDSEEGWTATWSFNDGYNGTAAGNYTATATLTAPAESLVTNPESLALTIIVTVAAAEGGDDSGDEITSIRGDINGDGKLAMTDLSAFKRYWSGKLVLDTTDPNVAHRLDVNGDGKVAMTDLSSFKRYWSGKFTMPE